MAVEVFGVVQIGGQIATIADVESFVMTARLFGADDDTALLDSFLRIEFFGTPQADTSDEGTAQAVIPLTVYTGNDE